MTPAALADHPARPDVRELDRAAAEAILARNVVGRLAFTFRDRVDIEPIHYAYADGWIYGRTSPGTKLSILRHNPWVAFEVDEAEALFDWRSVVVRGSFHLLEVDGPPRQRAVREEALRRLRALVPGTLADADPVPGRTVVFRIAIGEINGRESRSRDA